MARRAWVRYLHRLGYVTTAVVAVQLAVLGYMTWHNWHSEQVRRQIGQQASLMRDGPIQRWLSDSYRFGSQDAWIMVGLLPPAAEMGPDGFRFLALPSLSDVKVAVAMTRTEDGARGTLVLRNIPRHANICTCDDPLVLDQKIEIRMSAQEYQRLMAAIDGLARRWNGDDGAYLDGTAIIWERTQGGGLATGIGNSPLFYGEISQRLHEVMRPHVPDLARFDDGWNLLPAE